MKRLLAALLIASVARADTLHVPADFNSIQDAVDAAAPGDVILISSGEYEETVSLLLQPGLTLRGAGKVVLRGGNGSTAILTITSSDDVVLESLRFEAPDFAAVSVDACSGVRLSRCRVAGGAGEGFHIGFSTSPVLERCQVLGTANFGLRLVNCDGGLVFRCRIEDTSGSAISLSGTDGARVERCTILRSGGFGVVVGFPGASVGCSLLRNVLTDSGGVDVAGSQSSIRENKLVRTVGVGLLVEGSGTASLLEDNLLLQVDGHAIDIVADGVVARRNRVVKPALSGFNVQGAHVTLTDNDVIRASESGMILQPGVVQGHLSGNDVLKSGATGIDVSAQALQILGCRVLGSGQAGLLLTSGKHVVAHNLVKGSGELDLDAAVLADHLFFDNDFGTTAP